MMSPEDHRRARRHRIAVWVWAFLASLCLTAGVYLAQEHNLTVERDIQLGACERGNLVRAYLVVDAASSGHDVLRRTVRATALFPILDCDRTVSTGHPVPVSDATRLRVLKLVAQAR